MVVKTAVVPITQEVREYFKANYDTLTLEELRQKAPAAALISAATKVFGQLRKSAAPEDVIEAADYLLDSLGIPYVFSDDP